MIILLDGRPLVRSRVFDMGNAEDREEAEERRNDGSITNEDYNRDWKIYTFDSAGRLSGDRDETLPKDTNVVWAGFEDYVPSASHNSFLEEGLPTPDHIISITGYSSFINTRVEKVVDLARLLEREGIRCVVPCPTGNRGLLSGAKYVSEGLKRVEEIVL